MKPTRYNLSTPHTSQELRPHCSARKLGGIGLVGLVSIAGAWGLRQQIIQSGVTRSQAKPGVATSAALNNVSDNANIKPPTSISLLSQFQTAVTQAPRDINKRWQLAAAYQTAGQLENAAQQLQEIIRLAPHNLEARAALAKTDLALRKFKAAETTYIFLVQQAPRSASAWIGLAGALYHQGSYYEASEAARRAITLQPNDAGRYVLALCLMKSGLQVPNLDTGFYFAQLEEARDHLERLTKVWPDNGDIYYRLGQTYLGMSDGKNAVKNLLRARALTPKKMDVYLQLVKAYIKLGDYDNALKIVEEALKSFPQEASLWNARGQLYLNSDAPDALSKALTSCQQAVLLEPDKSLFHERLGVAYQRSGKLVEACREFETDIRINPHNIFACQQLAMLYRRLGNNQRAATFAQLASAQVSAEQQLKQLQIESRDKPTDVNLHLAIAERFRDLRFTGAARDEYLRAIKLDSTNKHALQGLNSLAPALARAAG